MGGDIITLLGNSDFDKTNIIGIFQFSLVRLCILIFRCFVNGGVQVVQS